MKYLITIVVAVLFIPCIVQSQSCLPQGITFTTQAQVDSFQTNYPGCTEIKGYVIIRELPGSNITNLNGLSVVSSIWGNLTIQDNNSLSNLSGLESLNTIGEHLMISSNAVLLDLSGLDNLDSIGGSLCIGDYYTIAQPCGLECLGNASLVNITALSNLVYIGGDLRIFCNDTLSNLAGLENLSTIGGSLLIGYTHEEDFCLQLAGNKSLTDIAGLQGVSAIGKDIDIQGNALLTSLSGLENIDASLIENLTIKHNESLSSCESQSVCDYLSVPGGEVNIYGNATGCNNPPEIAINCGIALPCLPFGNYYFLSQASIDNFRDHYPDCTAIGGDIIISGEDITNLFALSLITSIAGDLVIHRTALSGLNGLEALNSIQGDLVIGSQWFHGHPNLTNLSGLDGLNSIEGNLIIIKNDSIVSLSGIENLAYIGGWIVLDQNEKLKSIATLENIIADSIDGITIEENPSLSNCSIKSICDYLDIPYGYVFIRDNAPGCDSREEVDSACEHFSITELRNEIRHKVYPNPFSVSTTLSYTLYKPSTVIIDIINPQGQLIEKIELEQSGGEQSVQWNAKGLPPGMYYFRLKAREQQATGKLVVLR